MSTLDYLRSNRKLAAGLLVVALVIVVGTIASVSGERALRSVAGRFSSAEFDDLIVQARATVASIRNARDAYLPLEMPAAQDVSDEGEVAVVEHGPVRLRLSMVALDPEQPLAVLNNKMVGLQDKVAGYTVIAIEEDSVTVEDQDGNARTIPLYKDQGGSG